MPTRKRVLIMGAAGMDYHLFNILFRDNHDYEVVGFTMAAEQNLGTVGKLRTYPPILAGKLYPDGIPTYYEKDLPQLIRSLKVDEVYFAYSDIAHTSLMQRATTVLIAGARFSLIPPRQLQIKATKPVIAVCAVRTGCGKSQTSRRVYEIVRSQGLKAVAIREPMPYGDLKKQVWQRFANYDDLDRARVTIEEREEFEPYIEEGMVVYAGCDYAKILTCAESESDVIVWDGGNNEISFYVPDLLIVLADPLRAEDTLTFHPGAVNLLMADVVVINKEDSAKPETIKNLKELIKTNNPTATLIDAESQLLIENPQSIKGKKALIIEDGPTVTHGGMSYGAGKIAAQRFGASLIIDPKPYARGTLLQELTRSPHLDRVLPAMGYSPQQLQELEQTINSAQCDIVISATPIDLSRILKTNKPLIRVRYRLKETSTPDLNQIITSFLRSSVPGHS